MNDTYVGGDIGAEWCAMVYYFIDKEYDVCSSPRSLEDDNYKV